MPDPLVAYSDLELFLTGWYRAALAARPEDVCTRAEVDNVEPADGDPFPEVLVVIRDDGGPDTWFMTGERSIGVSVLADTEEDVNELMRIVHALRTQIPAVGDGSPVTAVLSSTAPIRVAEAQPRFRKYFPMTLGVVAEIL